MASPSGGVVASHISQFGFMSSMTGGCFGPRWCGRVTTGNSGPGAARLAAVAHLDIDELVRGCLESVNQGPQAVRAAQPSDPVPRPWVELLWCASDR